MSNFSMISELQSVREQRLREVARELALEQAAAIPTFEKPIELFRMWQGMDGDIPHFSNVKATAFGADMLPNMYILDVVPATAEENQTGDVDFRFRLFGTANRLNYGAEATGNRLSESAAAGADDGVASGFSLAQQSYHRRMPVFLICEYFSQGQMVRTASFVTLPLVDDDGQIVRLFGCATWAQPT